MEVRFDGSNASDPVAELFRQLERQGYVRWAHGYLIAHFPTLQQEERQDVIQDSYLRLLGSFWRVAVYGEINGAYLRAALQTAALDFFRGSQRRADVLGVDPWDLVDVAAAVELPSAEKTAQQTQFLQLARERINRMPPQRRKIMGLFLAGHTYLEIADMLGRSLSTVRNHLRAARQELRRSLPEAAMYAASL